MSTEERTVVDYLEVPIIRPPAPALPRDQESVVGPTFPAITTPSSPTRIPQVRTVTSEVFDAENAVELIRYRATIAALAIGAAGGLAGLAYGPTAVVVCVTR